MPFQIWWVAHICLYQFVQARAAVQSISAHIKRYFRATFNARVDL
jgi:hypothetical protein